jgi:probable rRNA maturation factor
MLENTLDIFNQTDSSELLVSTNQLKHALNAIFLDHQKQFEWINVVIMDNDEHTSMNNQYLGHNYPTDIITFEFEDPEHMNGELYINLHVAKENARDFRVSLENELSRLIIHGTLHLVGYLDKTEAEKIQMTENENKYLTLLND